MNSVVVPAKPYLGTSGASYSHIQTLEGYISPKKFGAIRTYSHIDMGAQVPGVMIAAGKAGKMVFLSIRSDLGNGSIPAKSTGAWKDLAAGNQDHYLASIASALKAYAHPCWVTYCHEPYHVANKTAVGSWSGGDPGSYPRNKDSVAAEWIAAYNHFCNYLLTAGVTNVSFAPIWQTQYKDNFATWLPAYHDWIFNDSYPGPGQSFAQGNSAFYNWAHNSYPTIPLGIGETSAATSAGTDGGRASWYKAVPAGLASQPQVFCWCQWDGNPWYGSGNTQTEAAFKAMANTAAFA